MRPAAGLKVFYAYLKDYFRTLHRTTFLLTLLFVSLLIYLNYSIGIEGRIRNAGNWWQSLGLFFLFYSAVFLGTWTIRGIFPRGLREKKRFFLLLFLSTFYFSCKMVHWDLSPFFPSSWQSPWDRYALIVLQLPAKLLLLIVLLVACRRWTGWGPRVVSGQWSVVRDVSGELSVVSYEGELDKWAMKSKSVGPYFLMLLFVLPLVALASTRPDFLQVYPKVKSIAFVYPYTQHPWLWRLLYEISYGLDFVSIEFFFRGWLVIGLVRYAGAEAILPMAAFYCTVHFGKPLGECISSFFGGLILGVIAWRTRSVRGGLIIHLGLAALMELGGYLGAAMLL